ncbi:MAG TPA: PAS domain S-box protein [Vicinamibacteria bacterium]|nr:PAS domain S-box protein [Vicinamibacteria bacterium]
MSTQPGSPGEDAAAAPLREYLTELERAQAQGPARFRDVFERPPAGIGVHELDDQGIITRVNAEELRLLGYAESQMVGRPAWDFAVMQGVSQRSVEKKLSGEKELKAFVRTFQKADGTGVALLVLDSLIKDAHGKARGIRTALMLAPTS